MNRKERRRMSKKLGIMEFQKKLPLNKKFSLVRENIIAGKQMQKELNEQLRVSLKSQEEEVESKVIHHLAENIEKTKHISPIEAIEEAKKEYQLSRKK